MTRNQQAWRKSSYSGSDTNCVEVAPLPGSTAVRDSKNPTGGRLHVAAGAWRRFVRSVQAGRV